MIIGVIGAGLAGLTAGKTLAQAGHDVVIFDESPVIGGRLATHKVETGNSVAFDYGLPYLKPGSDEYNAFINELEQKNLVKPWTDRLAYHNGDSLHEHYPGKERQTIYAAPEGMHSIARYMSRWVDFRLGVPVGSITYIGDNRHKKRAWMITLTDINVQELDAVILANSAVKAHGLIQTSQDETPFRRMIQTINRVSYEPSLSLMVNYGKRELPEWPGIICEDDRIRWISNESSKRENSGELALVIQSGSAFAKKYFDEPENASGLLLERASELIGPWAEKPVWQKLHPWRYSVSQNFINKPFLELNDHPSPFALVGDYFNGNTAEHAWLSGLALGRHWIDKFKD